MELWPGRAPALVSLSRVSSLGAAGFEIDPTHAMAPVQEADAAAEAAQVLPLARRASAREADGNSGNRYAAEETLTRVVEAP